VTERGGRDEQWTPRAASEPVDTRGRGGREKTVPVAPSKTELWESAGWESGEEAAVDAAAVPEVTIERVPKRLAAPLAVSKEVSNAVGPRRAPKVEAALMEASKAFDRERYGDALTILRALSVETPDVPAVRELFGLALYRQGKWSDALKHLVRFVELTGSVEQHPVIADCHRALRHHDLVQTYWDELAASSPSAELVAEGRIVMAGSFADQGRLGEAIALLERAPLQTKRPRAHHLRLWYALGDLYERAGDVPNAREWFARVLLHDPDLADTKERLENL
jgi:tetratricopeptide (TPR) repeat protein